MKLIDKYIKNKELKKFNRQEELRVKKESIRMENDLRIKKEKDLIIIKSNQMDCVHNYVVLNIVKRTVNYPFNLKEYYDTYDLICIKCHKEKCNLSEDDKNYWLNKSRIINKGV